MKIDFDNLKRELDPFATAITALGGELAKA